MFFVFKKKHSAEVIVYILRPLVRCSSIRQPIRTKGLLIQPFNVILLSVNIFRKQALIPSFKVRLTINYGVNISTQQPQKCDKNKFQSVPQAEKISRVKRPSKSIPYPPFPLSIFPPPWKVLVGASACTRTHAQSSYCTWRPECCHRP